MEKGGGDFTGATAQQFSEVDGRLEALNRQLLDDRETLAERDTLIRTVHQQTAQLLTSVATIEAEHAALGRRLVVIEQDNTGSQHGEIQALGRRVAKVEEQGEVLAQLTAKHGELATKHDDLAVGLLTQEAELIAEIMRVRDALLETLSVAMSVQNAEVQSLKEWRAAQEAWNARPWYRRFWRRLRGERP